MFRPVARFGRIQARALTAESVGDVVKAYAARAGYDAATFGRHLLRGGASARRPSAVRLWTA